MPMISYAQNGEDVVLNRLFPDGDGFYIDVGAHDPINNSVTHHFYERGWRGINVEPEPRVFARLDRARPRDRNLNVGLSDRSGLMDFHDSPAAPGWSSFSDAHAENLRARGLKVQITPVHVTTLAEVCRAHVDRPIDFLKVDAEGHEQEVIGGADWKRWRPRVVLIEAPWAPPWEHLLLSNDYLFGLFDGINRYYVREEDRGMLRLLDSGANFTDDYVSHAHWREREELRARLAVYEGLSPRSILLARRLAKCYRAVPLLPKLVHKVVSAA